MKTIIIKPLLISIALATLTQAGGKTVAPVDAAILPIETTTILPIYLGVGVTAAQFSACSNNCDYEDVTYGAMLRGGYDFNEYFGIEARGIRTFLDEGPFGGVPLQHIGLYAKPQYPVIQDFNVYGLLGYGYTENLGNGGRLNYFDNDHGFTAGLGLEYDLFKEWNLFVDYQRLLIKSNVPDMDALSVGLRYDF